MMNLQFTSQVRVSRFYKATINSMTMMMNLLDFNLFSRQIENRMPMIICAQLITAIMIDIQISTLLGQNMCVEPGLCGWISATSTKLLLSIIKTRCSKGMRESRDSCRKRKECQMRVLEVSIRQERVKRMADLFLSYRG